MNPLSIQNIWLGRPFLIPDAGLASSLRLSVGSTIRAHVLQANGSRAFLDIGGRTVVTQTMLALQAGTDLQLTVKGMQDGQLVLQPATARAALQPLSNDDIGSLLRTLQLPQDDLNFSIVRQMISQGMELTEQNISAIRLGLLHSHAGVEQAEGAVYLFQSRIPLTPGALQLLSSGGNLAFPASLWSQVLSALQGAVDAQGRYSDRTALVSLTQRLEEVLKGIDLKGEGTNTYILAERLHRLLESSGTPLEARLLNLLKGGEDQSLDGDLRLLLAFAGNEIERLKDGRSPSGRRSLEVATKAVQDLSNSVELQQLFNAVELNSAATRKTYWLVLPLLAANETKPAIIRVDQEGESHSGEQPAYPVRLRLDLDLSNLGPLQIDLRAWPERQLECALWLTNPVAAKFVEYRGRQLLESLHNAGFTVQKLECNTQIPLPAGDAPATLPAAGRVRAFKIDLKA